jgi:dienelactone hydrolase
MRNTWKTAGFAGIVAMATVSPAQAADYGAAGPLQVTTSSLPANEGGATGGYVIVPQGAGPYPLIIASHGWSAAADQQVGWGQQFASYGFVVVAPSFPSPLTPNDQTDATIIETLAQLYADPTHASPAKGKVDGTRVGFEGHSAGGLATTLASAKMHPQATVLFDPVDSNSDGKNALAQVCDPVLGLFADPSSCNNQEGWWPYANTTAGPATLFHVVGSTHCDGENTARSLCGSFCGGAAAPARQTVYARYATAFFLANLTGDANAAAMLHMGALSADSTIASVIVKGGTPCGATTGDGGAPSGSSSGASGSGGSSGGSSGSSGGGAHDAGSPGSGSSDASGSGGSGSGSNGGGTASSGGGAGSSSGSLPGTGDEAGTGSGDTPPPGSSTSSGGCACRVTSGATDALAPCALATGLLLLAGRRRRTR